MLVTTVRDCTHRNKSSIHNCKCKNTHFPASSPLSTIYLLPHTLAPHTPQQPISKTVSARFSRLRVDASTTKCCSGPPFSQIRLTELQNQFVQYFNVVFISNIWMWRNKWLSRWRCKWQLSSDESLQGPIKAPSITAITPCEAVGMLRQSLQCFLNYHTDIKLWVLLCKRVGFSRDRAELGENQYRKYNPP